MPYSTYILFTRPQSYFSKSYWQCETVSNHLWMFIKIQSCLWLFMGSYGRLWQKRETPRPLNDHDLYSYPAVTVFGIGDTTRGPGRPGTHWRPPTALGAAARGPWSKTQLSTHTAWWGRLCMGRHVSSPAAQWREMDSWTCTRKIWWMTDAVERPILTRMSQVLWV